MTQEEQIAATQLATMEHYRKAAEYSEARAIYDARASQVAVEKAKLELKTAELLYRRMQNANRPSMSLTVKIEPEERQGGTVYVVSYLGLAAEGESPEIACQNFDRLWAGVEHD